MPQKYEREIEEILRNMDRGGAPSRRVLTPLPPIERSPPRAPRLSWRPQVGINASGLMIVALCLAIVTYPLQWVYPPAVAAAGIVSAALLVAGVVVSVVRSTRGGPSRSWRGQPMEYRASAGGVVGIAAITRRWRRWKARRRFRDPRWN